MKTLADITRTTRRILLIDHELNVREIVELCLKDLANWDVLTTNSPFTGLEKAELDHPDAIVLDIAMRGSFMFLQQLRNNPDTQAIPVVVLSANVRRIDPNFLQHYQVAGIILKPFNPVTLPIDIAKLLNWNFTD